MMDTREYLDPQDITPGTVFVFSYHDWHILSLVISVRKSGGSFAIKELQVNNLGRVWYPNAQAAEILYHQPIRVKEVLFP